MTEKFYPLTKEIIAEGGDYIKGLFTERKYGTLVLDSPMILFMGIFVSFAAVIDTIDASGKLVEMGAGKIDTLFKKPPAQ